MHEVLEFFLMSFAEKDALADEDLEGRDELGHGALWRVAKPLIKNGPMRIGAEYHEL